ncbi:MAG: PSD1 domain-containing protein, partial [Planctomycetaceae bacterium]|nr:PSD1 domain-containing protein [Planctomycetaceae bacterium]
MFARRDFPGRTVVLALLLAAPWSHGPQAVGAEEAAAEDSAKASAVDYARDIQPLFAQHCVACHGPEEQQSGLRLDTGAGALAGGNSGPAIVRGKSAASLLLHALRGTQGATPMPAESEPLAAAEIDLFARWIDAGAPFPPHEVAAAAVPRGTAHWAFQPIVRPTVPDAADSTSSSHPVDRFIAARLRQAGLTPASEADRVTLLRRVTLDLIGLPPTPAEVDDFLADASAGAYERVVDRLLASPHYGERWGRVWLDAARYADSNGYTIDGPRTIWKYRDWVIDALNRDLPFQQFVIEQLAGDLLPDATTDQLIATGFHRNTLVNEEGGTDAEQFRVEAVVDRVSTTGEVLLGLTIGCARCHDHKYDPLSQRDFYQLFAFFNDCDEPVLELPTPAEVATRASLQPQIAELERQIQARADALLPEQPAWEAALSEEARGKFPRELQSSLGVAAAERNEIQQNAVRAAHRAADAQHTMLVAARDALQKQLPQPVTTLIVRRRPRPRTTHILVRGDFLRPGAEVAASVPAVLPPLAEISGDQTPTRLELAHWLFDDSNPLTARVAVNRLWQAHFGRGLVETDNDFGTQGSPPTHPELLDWLACEFRDGGWSLKRMHRLLVTSATYRQASHVRSELAEVDPDNRLLARQSRWRLDAEAI